MNILDLYGYNESPVGLVSTQSMQKAKDKEQDKLIQQIFSNPGTIGTGNPSTGGSGNSAGQQTNSIVNVEYLDLVELRDNGQLVPGQLYRITDYMTTTAEGGTRSAGHQFDVVVLAITTNTLSEDAWAVNHEFDDPEDDYFKDSNLSAWKVKYVLENKYWSAPSTGVTYATCEFTDSGEVLPEFRKVGITTYEDETYIVWYDYTDDELYLTKSTENASQVYSIDDFSEIPLIIHSTRTDSENRGKGTIIYMKDEFNNECTYDFKNIQYKRYLVDGPDLIAFVLPEGYLNDSQSYGFDLPDYSKYSFNGEDANPIYRYCYTFSLQNENGTDMDANGLEVVNEWTIEDYSMNRYCYDNSLIFNTSILDLQFGISETVFIGNDFAFDLLPQNVLMAPNTDSSCYNNRLYNSEFCTLFGGDIWNNDLKTCNDIVVKDGYEHTIKSSGSIFLEECNNCTIDSTCSDFKWTNSNTYITFDVHGSGMYENLDITGGIPSMPGTVYRDDTDNGDNYFITYSGSITDMTTLAI